MTDINNQASNQGVQGSVQGDVTINNYNTVTHTFAPGSAPPLPSLIIGRDDDLRSLKERLGIGDVPTAVHVLTAMRGWPGVGKTTLAAALAHDPDINQRYTDGVLWASLGQTPSLFAELASWGRALGVPDLNQARTIEEASNLLRGLMRNKRYLLIVDDVWAAQHAEPFRVGGPGCVLLITTRLPEVANRLAVPSAIYELQVLTDEAALNLLHELAPDVVASHSEESLTLVQELEGLPLALQVAGKLLHEEVSFGFGVIELLNEIREGVRLLESQAPADRAEINEDTIPTVAVLLQKSTDRLDEVTLECFAYLGAFAPKPATFDTAAMQSVWQVDDAKPTIRILVNRGLLEPFGDGRFWMHALLVKHARSFLT